MDFMPMFFAFELPAFLVGLLFGSFLNVCISRLPEHQSIVKPRSHCPNCQHLIRWHDNIPLLSWLILRARCRDCKTPISWRYPLVELSMGLLFLEALSRWATLQTYRITRLSGPTTSEYVDVASFAILCFLLIGLAVMDWQTHTLPDAFTVTGTAIGVFLVCVQAIFLPEGAGDIHLNPTHSLRMSSPGSMAAQGNVFLTGPETLVFGRLAAIVGAAGILLLIRWLYKALRHREGLGLGDVKLTAMIAAFLGFEATLLALFVGIISCAAYAVILLARRRAEAATRLPLGTFLALGGMFSAFFSTAILSWYKSLL